MIIFRFGRPCLIWAILLFTLHFESSVYAESFCDQALLKSNSFLSSNLADGRMKVSFSPQALDRKKDFQFLEGEIEDLLAHSHLNSFLEGDQILLPIFRTVRTEEFYRDYIFLLTLNQMLIVGRKNEVRILNIEKISEKNQKPLFYDLAERLKIPTYRLKARIKSLRQIGFREGPLTVEVPAPILAKIQYKHKINLTLLKSALELEEESIQVFEKENGRLELRFKGEENLVLIVVLAYDDFKKATLVTAYFSRENFKKKHGIKDSVLR